mgnify:CR=1 FL=1
MSIRRSLRIARWQTRCPHLWPISKRKGSPQDSTIQSRMPKFSHLEAICHVALSALSLSLELWHHKMQLRFRATLWTKTWPLSTSSLQKPSSNITVILSGRRMKPRIKLMDQWQQRHFRAQTIWVRSNLVKPYFINNSNSNSSKVCEELLVLKTSKEPRSKITAKVYVHLIL